MGRKVEHPLNIIAVKFVYSLYPLPSPPKPYLLAPLRSLHVPSLLPSLLIVFGDSFIGATEGGEESEEEGSDERIEEEESIRRKREGGGGARVSGWESTTLPYHRHGR